LDDDSSRKMSRFGFARGRQGSTATTSSPLHVPSPLAASSSEGHSFYNSSETVPSQPSAPPPPMAPWGSYYSLNGSATSSPLVPHAQAQPVYNQQQSRFQPFESGVSEAQLRDFIQSSRDRAGSATVAVSTPAGMRLLFV
jgi:CCR4-NOT transcription complex subunit 4